jgi:hypothetical protein
MVPSGMLRSVALVRTDVSEKLSASFIRMTRIGELGTTLAVTSSRRTLRRNTNTSETSVLTRAKRRNIPEDIILHSHRRENLKSYKLRLHYTDKPDNAVRTAWKTPIQCLGRMQTFDVLKQAINIAT